MSNIIDKYLHILMQYLKTDPWASFDIKKLAGILRLFQTLFSLLFFDHYICVKLIRQYVLTLKLSRTQYILSKRLKKDITKTCLFKYTEKFTTKKNENFQIKKSDVFHISAQNIDRGYSLKPPRRGGCNEYQQSMFLSRNKENNEYPCKPQFYSIKVGFKGVKII